MTTPDFTDERVQRIADVTFNDEDGEGANAEWWDLLASIDRELVAARDALAVLESGPDSRYVCQQASHGHAWGILRAGVS